MENQSIWYLENVNVMDLMCPHKVGTGLMGNVAHKTVAKGSYIYLPNEHADKIYMIDEGRVKIGTYSSSGKEITKAILGKAEIFGELSLIGQKKRRDFAIALEDCKMCVVTVEEMKMMMRERSDFSLFLMKIMGSRMLEMEQRLESLVFKDSRTRIIEFLYNLGKDKGQRVGYETLVRKFMTHQEIANLTATSRQTVTTVLNELRSDNILTFNRRRLLIRNMEQLAKEAGVDF